MIYIFFRNDDPCALSDHEHERRILKLFEKYNIPQVFAVTPHVVDDPHDDRLNSYHPLHENPSMLKLLQEYHQKGLIEIAQHGLTHQTNVFRPSLAYSVTDTDYFPGIDKKWLPFKPAVQNEYSEFNGLSIDDQREKVIKGQEYLEGLFGTKLKTFIFPWNTFNKGALEILRDRGFQVVPGEESHEQIEGLWVVGCCVWEISVYLWYIKDTLWSGQSALMQLSYHSWEMDEANFKKMEEVLKFISRNKNMVQCITPSQIPLLIPQARDIFALHSRCASLRAEANTFLKEKIESRRCYVLSRSYYFTREAEIRSVLFLAKHINTPRNRKTLSLGLLAVIVASLIRYVLVGSFNLASFLGVIGLGGLMCGVLLLQEREKRSME